MAQFRLFVTNYNPDVLWVYASLQRWVEERGGQVVRCQCASAEEVQEKAREADIYLAWKLPVTRSVIASLPDLKLLIASGSGYDHIDVPAATEHGVVVANAATHNLQDVAEHTLALLMTCGRKIMLLDRAVRQGQWRPGAPIQPVHRCQGRKLGIIGFGNIGRLVARKARAIGMHVLAYDPYVSAEAIAQQDVEAVTLEELLRRSDFVSPHLRLTPETHHLLNEQALGQMQTTAFVINTSRGGVIDEAALIRALQTGQIAGAALDVLEQEPPQPDHPLLSMDNVIVTGHSAGSTAEAEQDWLGEWLSIIEAFLGGRWPRTVVNPNVQPKLTLITGD